MVEALVQGLEGGGDNGGYIPGMCIGHSLVVSHFGPNYFSFHFGHLESLVLSFLFMYTNWSFHRDFTNNSNNIDKFKILQLLL